MTLDARGIPFLSLALAIVGCGAADDGADPTRGGHGSLSCTPGAQTPCACSDGTASVQVCSSDGQSLGTCGCGALVSGQGPTGSGTLPPVTDGNVSPAATPANTTAPTDPAATPPSVAPVDPASAPIDPVDPATTPVDPTATPTTTDPIAPIDPNAPVVSVPGIECGGPLDPVNYQPPVATITGRQVFIDYACNKPPGTPVTFILNLHGTMDLENGKIYQRGYLPAYEYVDTHDFVIATPKAITSQWGNGDGGQDLPHLLETIEWVYASFAEFDIRQMWVVGHSWGAMYARDFVCRAEFADRISGVVLQSGGSTAPACADRVSVIGTVGETDIVPGQVNQTAGAAAHGCSGAETYMVGNSNVTNWPSCAPGWVHRNYFMLGKGHGFDPADWPEPIMSEDIIDAILATRI